MAEIRILYRPAGPTWARTQHKDIIYIDDVGRTTTLYTVPDSQVTYHWGGHKYITETTPAGDPVMAAFLSTYPTEMISIGPESELFPKVLKIEQELIRIQESDVGYAPVDTNSNWAADKALLRADLPLPEEDNFFENYSPGSIEEGQITERGSDGYGPREGEVDSVMHGTSLENQFCFAAGTMVRMADGSEKPIEQIRVGDQVMSFDGPNGELVASTVTQTFETPDQLVIEFHGTYVTPGHVYACPDGQYRMLIDILEQDGAIVIADGRHIRARTGYEVGSDEHAFVLAGIVQNDGDIKAVAMRAGTIVGANGDGQPVKILEFMDDIGWRLEKDVRGFRMRDRASPEVMGFPWHYAGVPFDPRMVAEQFAEYRQGRIRVAKGRPVFAEDREFQGSIPERFITAH